MTKSCGSFVADVYQALLLDIQSAFPHLREELSRDSLTLSRCFESRGHGVFYSNLPKAGRVLDQVLELGSLREALAGLDHSIPFMGPKSNSDVRPRFMHGLWSLICDGNGLLLEEIDYVALSFLRQVYYLAKKVKVSCPADTIKASYLDFIRKDRELPLPREAWKRDMSFFVGDERGHLSECPSLGTFEFLNPDIPETLTFDRLLQRSAEGKELLRVDPTLGQRLAKCFALIATSLGSYNPLDWRCKHGPGAIAARSGKTWKYIWYSWPSHLEREFPIADFGVYSYSSYAASQSTLPCESLEEASRLIAVRKTFDKPRLIAAEPNSHQYCQQNVLDYLVDRIRQSWISNFVTLKWQGRNQELCRRASETRELATLDLSDASDSVSCDLVEVAFASNPTLLKRLIAVRTRYIKVPGQPHPVELRKFSTMGSAVTFPIQTLLFLGMALAVLHKDSWSPVAISSWSGQVSVYGDDIIVPTTQWERVALVLKALGFQVNAAKTFAKGFFRESCGLDSYKGVDVTPVYLSHPEVAGPESAIGLSATTNHFYKKWMLNVAETIRQTVQEQFKLPTVATDSGVAGFQSRVPPLEAPKFRWNVDLQRSEVRVLAVVTPKGERIVPGTDQCLLQFFTDAPDPHDEWRAGYDTDARIKLRPRWVSVSDLYGNWLRG